MFKNVRSALVIAPHADDEIIGCGGTIARMLDDGIEVNVLICTNASLSGSNQFSEELVHEIRLEAQSSHDYLGVSNTFFLDFPALKLNLEPQFEITKEISDIIFKTRSDVLFIPHPSDLHLDHKTVYLSSLVAARPHYKIVRHILCYETLSETNWSPFNDSLRFQPNFYVDISNYLDNKLTSFSFFKTQVCASPHPRSLKVIQSLASVRGGDVFVDSAEAFSVERLIV